MLIDELMPRYDVMERHSIDIRAPLHNVFRSLETADLTSGPITKVLMGIRTLPARLLRSSATESGATRIEDLQRAGFHLVGSQPPREIVLGVLGKFWRPAGNICRELDVSTFRDGPPAGFALAAWNFSLEERSAAETRLTTETRVLCAPDSRVAFRVYWLFVRPGSGLIRRELLAAVRRHAERAPEG